MKTWLCYILGHKYFVVKHFIRTARKVMCRRCGKAWGMEDHTKSFVEWDGELAELYEGEQCVQGTKGFKKEEEMRPIIKRVITEGNRHIIQGVEIEILGEDYDKFIREEVYIIKFHSGPYVGKITQKPKRLIDAETD